MILKCCIACPHHVVRLEGEDRHSHCSKENCWSRFSKCIALRALEFYLDLQREDYRTTSAIELAYRIQE